MTLYHFGNRYLQFFNNSVFLLPIRPQETKPWPMLSPQVQLMSQRVSFLRWEAQDVKA